MTTPRCSLYSHFKENHQGFPLASVIGGPNLTPENSNFFQKISGRALASRFATFLSSSRYSQNGERRSCGQESLILCNLFVKMSILGPKPFPENFICAEENWVLHQLQKLGV